MGKVNDNILFDGPGHLDKKLVPFASVEQALLYIPVNHRELGQQINVIENGKIARYHFATDINTLEKIKDVGAVTQIEFPDTLHLDGGFVWIHPTTLVKYTLYDNGTDKVWVDIGSVIQPQAINVFSWFVIALDKDDVNYYYIQYKADGWESYKIQRIDKATHVITWNISETNKWLTRNTLIYE